MFGDVCLNHLWYIGFELWPYACASALGNVGIYCLSVYMYVCLHITALLPKVTVRFSGIDGRNFWLGMGIGGGPGDLLGQGQRVCGGEMSVPFLLVWQLWQRVGQTELVV